MYCADCHRPLQQGSTVWRLEHGILGVRGVVALEDALVFCSETCLRRHLVPVEPDERIP